MNVSLLKEQKDRQKHTSKLLICNRSNRPTMSFQQLQAVTSWYFSLTLFSYSLDYFFYQLGASDQFLLSLSESLFKKLYNCSWHLPLLTSPLSSEADIPINEQLKPQSTFVLQSSLTFSSLSGLYRLTKTILFSFSSDLFIRNCTVCKQSKILVAFKFISVQEARDSLQCCGVSSSTWRTPV